jgi:hypothetical protein
METLQIKYRKLKSENYRGLKISYSKDTNAVRFVYAFVKEKDNRWIAYGTNKEEASQKAKEVIDRKGW